MLPISPEPDEGLRSMVLGRGNCGASISQAHVYLKPGPQRALPHSFTRAEGKRPLGPTRRRARHGDVWRRRLWLARPLWPASLTCSVVIGMAGVTPSVANGFDLLVAVADISVGFAGLVFFLHLGPGRREVDRQMGGRHEPLGVRDWMNQRTSGGDGRRAPKDEANRWHWRRRRAKIKDPVQSLQRPHAAPWVASCGGSGWFWVGAVVQCGGRVGAASGSVVYRVPVWGWGGGPETFQTRFQKAAAPHPGMNPLAQRALAGGDTPQVGGSTQQVHTTLAYRYTAATTLQGVFQEGH